MLGILANDHYTAFSADNLALFADGFYGRFYFHCFYLLLMGGAYLERHVILPLVRS